MNNCSLIHRIPRRGGKRIRMDDRIPLVYEEHFDNRAALNILFWFAALVASVALVTTNTMRAFLTRAKVIHRLKAAAWRGYVTEEVCRTYCRSLIKTRTIARKRKAPVEHVEKEKPDVEKDPIEREHLAVDRDREVTQDESSLPFEIKHYEHR